MRIGPGLVAVLLAIEIGSPAAQVSSRSRLFKDSRQALAIALALGRREVTVVAVASAGRTDAAAQDAVRLGGEVRFRADDIGYLRVRLPLERAIAFSQSANVQAAALDWDDGQPARLTAGDADGDTPGATSSDGAFQASVSQSDQWPPKAGDYPLRVQYSPLADLDAATFQAQSPTFDGRGTTIALLDGNMDLLLPEYQTAYALDGRRLPKFADFLNVTDPRDDADLNPQWVDMKTEVESAASSATAHGKTITLPRPGKFRIGYFDERRFNRPSNAAYIDQDVDRSGNQKGDDGLFGVLWDERTREVWVDTNRNLTFADDRAMTDYAERNDIGTFGKDDPKTPIRESIGFTVQTDPVHKWISINLGIYQHATGIMGSVVGNREPNGRIHGVAPGAQVVSMFYGVSVLHAAIEGLIRAFRDPRIDLIVFEQSVAMASVPYKLADAGHPLSVAIQRLTERYQKLVFVPGGNSPGFALVSEDGLASGAVSVGGYQSKDSYLKNSGSIVAEQDNMHWGGMSHGPSGHGAAKPDLLAPSGQISTDVGYRTGAARKGLFQLPPGYSVDGGTSTATPMAAAAAALVISAAKQRGLKYDAVRLKAALVGSARPIARLGAHEQGAGLIQVGAAFALLEKLQSSPAVTIVSRAPVRTRLSSLLMPPHEGVGLYEREGWKAGDRGERTITLTRTSGPDGPMTFSLRWMGNDGTFSGPATIDLPRGTPVAVLVRIDVSSPGVHSATLAIDHPSIPGHAHRVLCTIVASLPLTAEAGYSVTTSVTVPKPGDRSVFIDVPDDAAALGISGASKEGALRISLVAPDRDYQFGCSNAATISCAISRPSPGVWEINISNTDFFTFDPDAVDATKPKNVRITATAFAMSLDATPPDGWARSDGSATFPVRVTNRMGQSAGVRVEAGPLASVFQQSRTISQGEQHVYAVTVPADADWLRARVRAADPRADLDVYLLDCHDSDRKPAETYDRAAGGKQAPVPAAPCAPRAKATSPAAGGEVDVVDPAPGRWVVVVDAFSVPGGSVSYEYLDAYADSRLGAAMVTGGVSARQPGEQWSASTHVWSAALPSAPRVVAGRLLVTSKDVIGQARGSDGALRPVRVPLGAADLLFVR